MYFIGRLLQLLRVPGFVRPFRYYDGATGQVISIQTSPRYTILTVGGKEFFFVRETGEYDGFGAMSPDEAQPTADCKAACTQE